MATTKPRDSETLSLNGVGKDTRLGYLPNGKPVNFRTIQIRNGLLNSLGTRLFIFVLSSALVGVGALSYLFFQKIETAAEKEVQTSLDLQANDVELQLTQVNEATESYAATLRYIHRMGEKRLEAYKALNFEFFKKKPALAMAMGVGQTPFGLVPKQEWLWTYFYNDQGKKEQQGTRLPAPFDKVIYSELFVDDKYPTQDYYKQPLNEGKSLWSEPYSWYGVTMTSLLIPLRNDAGKIIAILGTDVNVTFISQAISSQKVYQNSGYFAIISPQEKVLSYPPEPQKAIDRADLNTIPELAAIISNIRASKEGSVRSRGNLIFFRRLPSTNWIMLATVPESAIYAPALTSTLIGAGAVTLLLAIIVLLFVRNLNKRLQPILDECNRMDEGKSENSQDTTVGRDEIDRLSSSFFSLVDLQAKQIKQKEKEARQLELLAEISRCRGISDLLEPLESFLAEVRSDLQCDRLVVYSFNPDWSGSITAESGNANFVSAKTEKLGDPCISQELINAYQNGRTISYNDVFNSGFHPDHLALMERLKIKSNLIVPVFRAGELYALLIAHHCTQQHNWQENELEILKQKAFSLGQALGGLGLLEQKEVVEQERQRSEKLQAELINLLSDVEGAASGDLTVRAQITADEIGIVADFFNAIIENLRDVVVQVKLASSQVTGSVEQSDVTIRELSNSALKQVDRINTTLQSMEQMTQSIQAVAASAKEAAMVSTSAANTAESGGLAVERTVKSILGLRDTVSETAKKVKRLGESSQQISKVIVLINQIALKTNLLAVNASIEAARAGEEGRGFAVVAEEVAALAAQSATATKEIERIVESIQRETGEVVEAMESSTTQVVEGTRLAEEAKSSLGQIVDVSRQVNALFQDISTATISQVETSGLVRNLMAQIVEITKQTSETSQEMSQALQSTLGITEKLQTTVGTFKV
jgi:methyl-accepting chemotaxis protein